MRIVFVTDEFPFPLDTGGNVRTFHLLRALAADNEVTLVATRRDGLTDAHIDEVRSFCQAVHLVARVKPGLGRELGALYRSLTGGMPFLLERHRNADISRVLETLFSGQHGYGGVHFNHLDTALYASRLPKGVIRVLDQHNVVTAQVRTTLQAEKNALKKVILARDLRLLTRREPQLCDQMDLSLACSDADAALLRSLGVRNGIAVTPNGVALQYFDFEAAGEAANAHLVFLGTLDYDPCEKAVWYFCNEIFPAIKARIPSASFTAIGRNPSARLLVLASADPAIRFTGRVDDVRPHVNAGAVFVVPLLSGSGTRLKILEAMAMGIPVVSTTIGAEGIAAVDGEHLLLADTPDSFASSVVRLIDDSGLRRSISHAARSLVDAKYGWEPIGRELSTAYRKLGAARAGRGNG